MGAFDDLPDDTPSLGAAPDIPAKPDAFADISPEKQYSPSSIEGSAYNQMRGWLHGLAAGAGAPVDIVAAGLRKVGVPVGDEPFLGSASIQKLMDVPGKLAAHAGANEALDYVFGKGTSDKYGFWGHATYSDINQVPEVYRPQARFGEVMGATLPMIATPMALASDIGGTLAAARVAPTSALQGATAAELARAAQPGYAATMLPAAIGAGAGAYGAETVFPGSEAAQLVSQLAGGVGIAGGIGGISGGLSAARRRLTEPLSTLTEEGATRSIARALAPEFEKHGEDVGQIIKNLQAVPEVQGILPAERAGSNVLMGVQQTLAKKDEDLANIIAEREAQYRQNLGLSLQEAFQPGPQASLTEAAARKSGIINNFVENLASRAEEQAASAVSPIIPLSPVERELANTRARGILDQSLASARTTENQLWGAVNKDTPVRINNILDAYNSIKKEMLPGATFPAPIQAAIKSFSKNPVQPLGIVQELRSELLNQARMARASSDFKTARRLNILANGERGEVGGALGDMATAADPNISPALQFSMALNERFSQGFAGDVLGMKTTGEEAVRPALTLEAAAAGSPALAAQKFHELRQASGPIGEGPNPEMGQAQEQYLRSLSQNIVDPITGRVKPRQVASFMQRYGQILDQFPAYKKSLQEAAASQMAAESISGKITDTMKAAQNAAFSKVLKAGEIPSDAIKSALEGSNPNQDFTKLSALARSGGPNSIAGLRSAVLSYITDKAATGGALSFKNIDQLLKIPIVPNGPSLADAMVRNRIASQGQMNDILNKVQLGVNHETAAQKAVRISDVGDEAGRIARWGARILGAKLASRLGATGGGAGPSLQVAQIAAQAAESALAKMPVDRARNIISRAMQQTDPQKLIAILEKIGTIQTPSLSKRPSVIPILRPLVPESQSKSRMIGARDINP